MSHALRWHHPWQQSGLCMYNEPLGPWFQVSRHQIRALCLLKGFTSKITSYKYTQTSTTNIYHIEWTMEEEMSSDSHPITTRGLGEGRLWIWKSYKQFDISPPQSPNEVIEDGFIESQCAKLFLISDISLHVEQGKMAGA